VVGSDARLTQCAAPYWKRLAAEWVPPLVVRWGNALLNRRQAIRYTGNYRSWEDARGDSDGYDQDLILAAVCQAARLARDGEVAFERDAVTFDRIESSYPLLAGLLRIACLNGNYLHVLDFGGSLGSTYYQCRRFLQCVTELHWSVVEQAAFVECGQREFESGPLRFFVDLETCYRWRQPNVVLLSGVVQYVADPHALIHEILDRKPRHVIVDRTPMLHGERDRLTVQRVPPFIYGRAVRYPAWFLGRNRFMGNFASDYLVESEFPALDSPYWIDGSCAVFSGFLFDRK